MIETSNLRAIYMWSILQVQADGDTGSNPPDDDEYEKCLFDDIDLSNDDFFDPELDPQDYMDAQADDSRNNDERRWSLTSLVLPKSSTWQTLRFWTS